MDRGKLVRQTSVLLTAALVAVQVSYAQLADTTYTFDIDGATLGEALDDIYEQTGIQLLYPHELADTTGVNSVEGRYTVDEALRELLRDTSLSGRLIEGGVIVVSPKREGAAAPIRKETDVKESTVRRGLLASASAIIFGVGQPAIAQDQDSEPETIKTLETIVVSGLKREQSILDAPAGVSVIDGGEIERLSADSITDFLQLTPGLSLGQSPRGNVQIQIRGVNSLSGASPVGFYLDDLAFSFINLNVSPDASPFDLQSVEVLRGSQGTLYGAGASGGVVLINTNDPVMNEYQAKFDANASFTEGGEEGYSLATAINLPLIEDKLALRGVFSFQDEGGWIDDTLVPSIEDINGRETINGRVKLLATPTEDLSILVSAALKRSDRDLASDLADDSGNIPVSAFGFEALGQSISSEENYDQYGAVVEYSTPWFDIRNSLSYIDYETPNATLFILPIPTVFEAESLVNELRFTSNNDGPLSWVGGVFYRDAEQFIFQDASFVGLTFSPIDMGSSTQWSVYGDASLELWDGLVELSAGGSYFTDDVENVALLQPDVPDPIISSVETELFSPQVTATYNPNDDLSFYARYAEGFRPGINDFAVSTFFAQFAVPSVDGLVDAEEITSYEIGAKGQFFDNTLQAQFAAFWNSSEDVQQTGVVIDPGTGISATTIINAGESTSRGVELSVSWAPIDGLSLYANGSYIDAEVAEDFFAEGADPTIDAPIFVEGTPIYLVPEYTAAAGGTYDWPLTKTGLEAAISGNLQYTSERPLTSLGGEPIFGDEFLRADLRAEVRRDNWTLYTFVENITDEDGVITPDPNGATIATAAPIDGLLGLRTRPRTFGLGLRVDY